MCPVAGAVQMQLPVQVQGLLTDIYPVGAPLEPFNSSNNTRNNCSAVVVTILDVKKIPQENLDNFVFSICSLSTVHCTESWIFVSIIFTRSGQFDLIKGERNRVKIDQ